MATPQYYSSLLPYQVRGLPNATRQIELFAWLLTGEQLPQQLLEAFNLDTAVGAQLDILGKYVGVSRNVGIVQVRPYFALWSYGIPLDPALYQGTWNPTTNSPALSTGTDGQWWVVSVSGASTAPISHTWLAGDVIAYNGGFAPYTTGTPDGNGLTAYASPAINAEGVFYQYGFSSGQNSNLTDDQYRVVIKLKIVQNSSDGSLASIMAYLQQFFPGLVFLVDNKDMTLSYTVLSSIALSQELLQIYLPRPMAVGISVTVISPVPGGGDMLTTEGGDVLTTEGGDPLLTETT